MDLDRQAIERRDFPIGRRGYDTAAVDAHLRALAVEVEELKRAAAGGGESSLASTAGSQVQSIIQAAENAAAEIERQAGESARLAREEAERDAERTRGDAVEKSRVQVAAVSQVATKLLQRVGSMDGEVAALMETLRGGAGRISGDLAAVEKGMGDLYDAASGRSMTPAPAAPQPPPPASANDVVPAAPVPPHQTPAPAAPAPPDATPVPAKAADPGPAAEAAPAAAPASADVDGARLIALNMALNGESRADTDRYLAANFQLDDRTKLIDEVYAAIEG
ncbi:MAG: DivIVA protein [Solirubrobacterales bacterium]|nr:DivIVA protein [Solirubrobacterales bacterium]